MTSHRAHNGCLHVPHPDAEELAVRAAEGEVASALAFRLADIDQHQVTADLFVDPVCRTLFVALDAFHRNRPDEEQCPASRLTQHMAASPGLSHLLRPVNSPESPETISPADIASLLDSGWHTSGSIAGNVAVLRDAHFRRSKRQMLVKLAELQSTLAEFLTTARNRLEALAESTGLQDRFNADPWTLPVDVDEPWPEPLGSDALIGSVGDFVRIVGPHT